MSHDLFGEAPAGQPMGPGRGPKDSKQYTRPHGYAGTPDAGPEEKWCRNCASYSVVCGGAKSFPKRQLTKANWTRDRSSDILANSPACQFFDSPSSTPE
ncbi:hypothetical protein ACVWWJ_001585 [Luteibacter sp. HA06]